MNINWFPGHMSKTLKQMQTDSRLCDCFLYVLDARCPLSCFNPEFEKVVGRKPIIFILNKADMITKTDITRWVQYFNDRGQACIPLNATASGNSQIIIRAIKRTFEEKLKHNKERQVNFITRAMILGVPNSGKSTIANNLCNKSKATTGNKAGVTRSKQWVKVEANIEIMDTPGVLLPNFDDESRAYNLAFVGSVRDDILNMPDIAGHLILRLLDIDKAALISRYDVDFSEHTHYIDLLDKIARKRGCIIKGGEIDYDRVAKLILTDFRSLKLGKICLE